MDAKDQMVEKSANSSSNDDSRIQDEAVQNIHTSFVDLTVVGNLLSLSVTIEDVEAIQASKSNDDFNTSAEGNTDCDFSRSRVFPNVPFDIESSCRMLIKDFSRTREFPDVPLDSESSKENLTKAFSVTKVIAK